MKIKSSKRNVLMRGYDLQIFIGDIEIYNLNKEVGMNCYELPKENRWLDEGDSPYTIGGRDTDISQVAYSLQHRVKEMYDINCVPEKIMKALKELTVLCLKTEKMIESTINLISEDRAG